MRLLWFIDEVEARWQLTMRTMPAGTEVLTRGYCEGPEFLSLWDDVASFIGGGHSDVRRANCTTHSHTDEDAELSTDAELKAKDAEYWRLMQYDQRPELARLINATQQSTLCPGSSTSRRAY